MGRAEEARRLIVNADDFGRSHSINRAVVRAHQEGILTTASLMVNGEAFDDAVESAHQNPGLGVGLHLTLVCGRCTLQPREISGLVNAMGDFRENAVRAGFDYFFRQALAPQLEREISAQFDKFEQTGLKLDHVNGHLNMHLHPTVFRLLLRHANRAGFRKMRLTRDPLLLNLRLARGRWLYRCSHAAIFNLLSWRVRAKLDRAGIRHTPRVFGLLQNGRVDEDYLLKMLLCLPPGDSELYSHPCIEKSKAEFAALVSPQVRCAVEANHVRLVRYQDL
jgi:chitin disaccharide deacetylase